MAKSWGSFTIPGKLGSLGPFRNTGHGRNSPSDFHLAFFIHVWIILSNFHSCLYSKNERLEDLVTGRRPHKLRFRERASPNARARTTQQLAASHQNHEYNKKGHQNCYSTFNSEHAAMQLIDLLSYKFRFPICVIRIFHWHNPSGRPGVDLASNRKEYQEYFLVG